MRLDARLLFCALLASCGLADEELKWQVASPDRVTLEAMSSSSIWVEKYDRATTILPADDVMRTVDAPYRSAHVPARRNADGSIDLGHSWWNLVPADGHITRLRMGESSITSDRATAFLGSPPTGHAGVPWQLRLSTPRDNLIDARVTVRRNRVWGGVALGFSAFALGLAAYPLYVGITQHDTATRAIGFSVSGIAIGAGFAFLVSGLYSLLRREHDVVLTPP